MPRPRKSLVHRETPRKQLNTHRCTVCGAKRGEPCFRLTATSFIELKTTHASQIMLQTEAQGALQPRRKRRQWDRSPDHQPMALDATYDAPPPPKTSTEKLDREYAWKKAREAAGERRRNGG